MFDAAQYEIANGGGPKHPSGKFPARITATGMKPNKQNDGHYLEVEFETPSGKIVMRYNLYNNNAQAVDIAQKQLAALCYATGVLKLDMQQQGREFVGKQLQIEVRDQQDNRYSEVSRVFDAAGNEPSKGGPAASQQQQQNNNNGGGGWNHNNQTQQQQNNNNGGSSAAPWAPGGRS